MTRFQVVKLNAPSKQRLSHVDASPLLRSPPRRSPLPPLQVMKSLNHISVVEQSEWVTSSGWKKLSEIYLWHMMTVLLITCGTTESTRWEVWIAVFSSYLCAVHWPKYSFYLSVEQWFKNGTIFVEFLADLHFIFARHHWWRRQWFDLCPWVDAYLSVSKKSHAPVGQFKCFSRWLPQLVNLS